MLGYLVARWAVPGTDDTVPLVAGTVLVVIATMPMVASALPLYRGGLGALQHEPMGRPAPSPAWMGVLDGLILVVAAGAVLISRRAAEGGDSASSDSLDVLAALTPGLIGLAVGVLVSRLFPHLMAALGRLSARDRDLVPYLGFRRGSGRDLAARLPIVVLVLCVSTTAFAVILRSSIVIGQQTQTWHAVGADFTVQRLGAGSVLSSSLDPAGLPGVVATTDATLFPRARIRTGSRSVDTRVLAVDLEAYHAMTAGTPGDPHLPATMLGDDEDTPGPVRAIVSADWPIELALRPGDVLSVDLGSVEPVLVVAEVRDHYPGLVSGEPFVVVDSAALEDISGDQMAPTIAYLEAPRASEGPIEEALARESVEYAVASRYQVLDDLLADPLVQWAKIGLTLVIVFATVLAVVTGVSSLTIGSAPRRRDLGYLRAIGLDDQRSLRLTLAEQLPALALATVVGTATGVLAAELLAPALGIDEIVAGIIPVSIQIDWALILWMAGALVAAVTLAVVIFVGVDHRRAVTSALRMGEG
jgi:putative ABC transport system permease protein